MSDRPVVRTLAQIATKHANSVELVRMKVRALLRGHPSLGTKEMTGWVSSPVPESHRELQLSGEPAIGLTIRVVLSRYCTDEVCRLSTLRAANYVISVVESLTPANLSAVIASGNINNGVIERIGSVHVQWFAFDAPSPPPPAEPSPCLLYTSPSPRDRTRSRMPSSA